MLENIIIFIYPKIKIMPSIKTYAPQAFLYIASCLEENGYKSELIDARVDGNYVHLINKALEKEPLYVGVTSMTGYQAKHGLEIARQIKQFNKDIPIVWGGLHGSLFPEDILSDRNVNLAVLGEGEESAVALANYFSGGNKKSLGEINGIAYRRNEKVYFTKRREFVSLDKIPIPAWHLLKERISNYIIDGSIDILTSRGCPHRCRFCYNESYHRRLWRGREVKHVLNEIDTVIFNSPIPIKKINFIDDNFFTDKERALKICLETKKRNLKMHVDIRSNYVSSDLIEKIYNYGVDDFYFGIESGSQKMLDLMQKDISINSIFETIAIFKKYNFKTVFSFLLGYPGEEIKDIKETLSMASYIYNSIKNCNILMNIYTAYPGTDFFAQFKNNLKNVEVDFFNWNTARSKPWIKNRIYIESICTLFRFLNLPLNTRHFGILKIPVIFILHNLAKFRLKHNWFNFPLEFILANHFIQRYKFI